jgi:hypothetical protein
MLFYKEELVACLNLLPYERLISSPRGGNFLTIQTGSRRRVLLSGSSVWGADQKRLAIHALRLVLQFFESYKILLMQCRGAGTQLVDHRGLPRIAIPVSKLEPGGQLPAFELVGAQRRPG